MDETSFKPSPQKISDVNIVDLTRHDRNVYSNVSRQSILVKSDSITVDRDIHEISLLPDVTLQLYSSEDRLNDEKPLDNSIQTHLNASGAQFDESSFISQQASAEKTANDDGRDKLVRTFVRSGSVIHRVKSGQFFNNFSDLTIDAGDKLESREGTLGELKHFMQSDNADQVKKFIRRNNWSAKNRIRLELWKTLCSDLKEADAQLVRYEELALKLKNSTASLSNPAILSSPHTVVNSYMLNSKGLNALMLLLTVLEHERPDFAAIPIIYSLGALLLHYMSDAEAYVCIMRLISHSQKFLLQTEIAIMASRKTISILAKKHMVDKLFYKHVHAFLKKMLTSKSDDDVVPFFNDWSRWIFSALPFSLVVRVVDCFLWEGHKIFYRVALALTDMWFKEKHGELKNASGLTSSQLSSTMFDFCTTFSATPAKLLKAAFSIRNLQTSHIRKLQEQNELNSRRTDSKLIPPSSSAANLRGISGTRHLLDGVFTSDILNESQVLEILQQLPARYQLEKFTRIFCTSLDGLSFNTLWAQIDGFEPTILIIKTDKQEIFGAFCSSNWSSRRKTSRACTFGTGESFVFVFNPSLRKFPWVGLKKTTGQIGPGDELFQSADATSLVVGGSIYRSNTYLIFGYQFTNHSRGIIFCLATKMEVMSICSSTINESQYIRGECETTIDESRKAPSRHYINCIGVVGCCEWSEETKSQIKASLNVDLIEIPILNLQKFAGNKSIGFVLNSFEGTDFSYLHAAEHRIFGPTVLLECSRLKEPLPLKPRPLFCQSMRDVVVCFGGFKDRVQLTKLVAFVHYMGGSVRKELTASCTHVISNSTQTNKYRLAVGMGRPVMSEKWIFKCWERRFIPLSSALSEDLLVYKLPPFHNLNIYFHGFAELEKTHMREQAKNYGAFVADSAKECTHVVFDNAWLTSNDFDSVLDVPHSAHRVKAEWFWLSIQLNVCANEEMYRIMDKVKIPKSNAGTPLSPSNHLNVLQKSRRSSFFNRRHEVSNDNRFSMSAGSFFDASGDASSILADHIVTAEDVENFLRTPKRCMSKRQQTCLELLQTENNYFQVLKTIVKYFKEPLEKPDLIGGEILDITESRLIFGHIPPIFEVHSKINSDLASLIMHWNENRCIGDVFLSYKEDLLRSYPPFVNFFEKTKATLLECDKTKPRFHAFLKVCQSKPECQRQSLQELLIRPVQRLPSVILLLNDILKHTDKVNPDHSSLQQAIEALKGVLTHINDDKRKTEGQVKLFDIVHDIKNCPPYLLSSQRSFVSSAEVVELSDGFKRKGANLTFYVFNDCLEIAEKRLCSSKQDSYSRKHAELLFLSHIRRIINVKGHADSDSLFCLTIRDDIEGDKNYPFQFLSSDTKDNKARFLNIIRNQISITRSLPSCFSDHVIVDGCKLVYSMFQNYHGKQVFSRLAVVTVTGRIGFEVQEYDISCKHNETDLSRTIFKAVKRVKSMSSKLPRTISKTGSFQRTVSHIWNGTLSRMSRSNLRLHYEECHQQNLALPKSHA